MNLVNNASRAYRMSSMQLMAAAVAFQEVASANPDLVAAVIPTAWVPHVTAGLVLAGMVARLVRQPSTDPVEPKGGGGPGEPEDR